MAKIIVIDRQTFLDVALQEYGNTQAVFDLVLSNGLNITDELEPGQELILPNSDNTDNDVLNFYKARTIKPVTSRPTVTIESILFETGFIDIEIFE
jgi:hypothetical protein